VRKSCFICLGLCFGGLLVGLARAETFELNDNQMLSGEIVSYNENGLIVRQPDDKYSDRIPWTRFSQADLKTLAGNPKIAPWVEPFIEVSEEEKLKKTDVETKPVPRLEQPRAQSFFGALLSSSLGLAIFFVLYTANLYAAYEVSIFRSRRIALVCGLAAVPLFGFLVPIVFLSIPTRVRRSVADEVGAEASAKPPPTLAPRAPPAAAERAPEHAPRTLRVAHTEATHPAAPPTETQVFRRGAFTFNRRFFETRFPGFFGFVRRDVEKNLALVIKSVRGEFVGQRIARITANELHLQVQKGAASEEILIPFVEIQEVLLQHRET
jgi:hypothetical protein